MKCPHCGKSPFPDGISEQKRRWMTRCYNCGGEIDCQEPKSANQRPKPTGFPIKPASEAKAKAPVRAQPPTISTNEAQAGQCPHCFKHGLDPRATKCHNCGGDIVHPMSWFDLAVWWGLALILAGVLIFLNKQGIIG
jgi:hypothetical protein